MDEFSLRNQFYQEFQHDLRYVHSLVYSLEIAIKCFALRIVHMQNEKQKQFRKNT